ncbi:MAG: FtsX-like permease family protein [bacterium]
MLIVKLAYRNIKGAGLRTWLNVAVLSMAYVLIIWHQGLFTGMLKQASNAMISDEIGGGQYWHENYDPYDPLTYEDSHAAVPQQLEATVQNSEAVAILIRQGTIYPEGRMQSVLLKGIDPSQKVLDIPTASLVVEGDILPVMVGRRMAKSMAIGLGDELTIRWRDANGTFDAVDAKIAVIMDTEVINIDKGQLWLPLERLREMARLEGEATIIVVGEGKEAQDDISGWIFRDRDFLLSDIYAMVRSKRVSSTVMYSILLFLAILAIFDTQVLAIFRRRKEIGTLIALGMTRFRVVALFTLEGAIHGILAIAFGAIYGIPLIVFTARHGIGLPQATESYGYALTGRLFPSYSLRLVLVTVFIVMTTVTIVSFMPSRKIAKLKPTEALKGKLS